MTQKIQRSPGPWVAVPVNEGWIIETANGYESVADSGEYPYFCIDKEADAHLIAAAPDLLEALKWLARGEHEWSVPQEALAFMERAIAKAEPVYRNRLTK